MNRRQQNQDKRNQKIVAVLDAHAPELATVPAVAEAAADLRQRLSQVQPALSQQLASREGKGATQAKNNLEAPLIGQLVKAANALSLLYKKTGRLDQALALLLRRSEYEKLAQPALAAEAQELADQVRDNLGELAPYGYKKGADTQLRDQVAAYAASLPGRRTAAGRGKVGTATVRTVFQDVAAYIESDFRSAVELLVDEHPELYKLLREAMRIDDTGGSKKAKTTAPAKPGTAL
jgi:CRP-like cAMP-binding protein